MSVAPLDELNNVSRGVADKKHKKGIPYKEYFDVMGISDDEKNNRISLANDIEDALFILFALKDGGISREVAENQFKAELLDLIATRSDIDDYVEELTSMYAKDITKTTYKHSDEYYTSPDRAINCAEDMANSYENYFDYSKAIASGKTKTWKTQSDTKVRWTHFEVDNQTIDAQDTFKVGDSIMRFPKDIYYGASADEICNCRCWVEYK